MSTGSYHCDPRGLGATYQAWKHLEQDSWVAIVNDAASTHVCQALGAGQLHFDSPVPLREGDDIPDQVAAVVHGARDLQSGVLVVEDEAREALQRRQLHVLVGRAHQQVQRRDYVHLDQRVLMLGRLGAHEEQLS